MIQKRDDHRNTKTSLLLAEFMFIIQELILTIFSYHTFMLDITVEPCFNEDLGTIKITFSWCIRFLVISG